MKYFLSDDGYMLHQVVRGGVTFWTDDDLEFDDAGGVPIGSDGPLSGRLLPETVTVELPGEQLNAINRHLLSRLEDGDPLFDDFIRARAALREAEKAWRAPVAITKETPVAQKLQITISGPPGSGKTTLAFAISTFLRGNALPGSVTPYVDPELTPDEQAVRTAGALGRLSRLMTNERPQIEILTVTTLQSVSELARHCDECGALIPADSPTAEGPWHKDSCSLKEDNVVDPEAGEAR